MGFLLYVFMLPILTVKSSDILFVCKAHINKSGLPCLKGDGLSVWRGLVVPSVAFVNENYDEISSSTNLYHVTKTRRDATKMLVT